MNITVGQVWTFVHRGGGPEVRGYVVEHVESTQNVDAAARMVRLLNPATGKHAHVSVHWMHRKPDSWAGGHWVLEKPA